ncbi:hypothetical protein U1Q18_026056, partial [Sarracenia purpurea var. burkii]
MGDRPWGASSSIRAMKNSHKSRGRGSSKNKQVASSPVNRFQILSQLELESSEIAPAALCEHDPVVPAEEVGNQIGIRSPSVLPLTATKAHGALKTSESESEGETVLKEKSEKKISEVDVSVAASDDEREESDGANGDKGLLVPASFILSDPVSSATKESEEEEITVEGICSGDTGHGVGGAAVRHKENEEEACMKISDHVINPSSNPVAKSQATEDGGGSDINAQFYAGIRKEHPGHAHQVLDKKPQGSSEEEFKAKASQAVSWASVVATNSRPTTGGLRLNHR